MDFSRSTFNLSDFGFLLERYFQRVVVVTVVEDSSVMLCERCVDSAASHRWNLDEEGRSV